MTREYVTVQGDTWDAIAFRFYRDENAADVLMDANPDKIDRFIFEAGVRITIPDIAAVEAEKIARDFPAWRQEAVTEESRYE